jgi:DNA-binding response OmpR family regulator
MTPTRRARVLIADDDHTVLQLLHEFLIAQGYEVATVATGHEVLDALPRFQPDVIIVDLLMPALSGTDVLAAVRQAGLTVPVILVSGGLTVEPEGFFRIVRKPFALRRLGEVVTAAVEHGGTDEA